MHAQTKLTQTKNPNKIPDVKEKKNTLNFNFKLDRLIVNKLHINARKLDIPFYTYVTDVLIAAVKDV
ncbi:MAG: hypothetical protein ACYCVH_12835 [Ignavibacteriaceae bacterium]